MVDVNTPQDNILYLSTALVIMDGEGSPEGVVNAALGSLYCDKLTGDYYKKGTAIGTLTGWTSFGGGGGGTIAGSIALNQVAVGSAANTIGGSSAFTFASGVLGLTGTTNPGVTITGTAATESGITVNQSVTGATANAFVSLATSSDQTQFRLTSDTFTPSGLVKARQIDFLGATGVVEFLLRLADSSSRFVFGINNGEAMSVSSSTSENLVLGSPSTGAVPRNAQIKFYNSTNANYTQLRATAFAANRIWDLPTGSPTGTQALVGSLSGSTITLDWGSASAALTSTQIGFGSGANALTGSADFTYADATGVIDLVKTGLNSSVRFVVTNSNVGNAAQARVAVSADTSGAALIAYSSAFATSGLRVANSSVLDLDGPNAVILGQAAGVIQLGLGVTEYARLNTTRLGLLGLGLGATPSSLDVLLERDAANTLAQRNDTNTQTLRVYKTYTDASNYERVSIGYSASTGAHTIGGEMAGTGTIRTLALSGGGNVLGLGIAASGVVNWTISGGHFLAGTDNSYDIGASGATRPRRLFLAGYLVVGGGIYFNGRGWVGDGGSDGVLLLQNNAQTDFSRLQFGGTTSSFPAIKRSAASLQSRLADDSGYSDFAAAAITGTSLGFFSASRITSPVDGNLLLQNAATSDFGRLQFGGTTSSFPAIGRSNASLVISLADGTLATNILPINTNQLQFGGADAASPGAISLRVQNVLTGTSNTSGQNLSIYGCAGTGDQPGGQIILRVAPAGSSGTSQNATIVGLAVTGSGQVYGAALHNNNAGMSGATNQYVGSGTYSPTITAVANCSVTTPGVNFKYLRVGNVVQVTGQLAVDPTTASTLTRVRIELPIASNLTGSVGCQGTANCADVFGLGGAVYPDTTNDAAELNFICEGGTPANNVWCVSFSYEVA